MASSSTQEKPAMDEIGQATGMGFIGGVVWSSLSNFWTGMRDSPKGSRFMGARQAVRMNALQAGGELAVFCCLSTALEKTIGHVRQKDDPWNRIFAGSAAVGLLNMRRGFFAASGAALLFGATVAVMEVGQREIMARVKEEEERLEKQMKAGTSNVTGILRPFNLRTDKNMTR